MARFQISDFCLRFFMFCLIFFVSVCVRVSMQVCMVVCFSNVSLCLFSITQKTVTGFLLSFHPFSDTN